VQKVSLEVAIESYPKLGAFCDKLPQKYAEESELIQEFD